MNCEIQINLEKQHLRAAAYEQACFHRGTTAMMHRWTGALSTEKGDNSWKLSSVCKFVPYMVPSSMWLSLHKTSRRPCLVSRWLAQAIKVFLVGENPTPSISVLYRWEVLYDSTPAAIREIMNSCLSPVLGIPGGNRKTFQTPYETPQFR